MDQLILALLSTKISLIIRREYTKDKVMKQLEDMQSRQQVGERSQEQSIGQRRILGRLNGERKDISESHSENVELMIMSQQSTLGFNILVKILFFYLSNLSPSLRLRHFKLLLIIIFDIVHLSLFLLSLNMLLLFGC